MSWPLWECVFGVFFWSDVATRRLVKRFLPHCQYWQMDRSRALTVQLMGTENGNFQDVRFPGVSQSVSWVAISYIHHWLQSMSNTCIAKRQTWERGRNNRASEPLLCPSPTFTPFELMICKAVTDIIVIGLEMPPACLSSACDSLPVDLCSYTLLLSVHFIFEFNGLLLHDTWEQWVSMREKPKPPICTNVLSLYWPSTSITMNHEITVWHLNKAKGISNTDSCLESQSMTIL